MSMDILWERGKMRNETKQLKSDANEQQYDHLITHLLNRLNTDVQRCDNLGHSAGSNSLPFEIHTWFVLHRHTLSQSAENELTLTSKAKKIIDKKR